ncbi:MAG TPA: prephenate dehydrogenase/arogenate dehydrogenase family protein [Aquificaceae bacterium]|nr:prephenate dehydrogenase/arogenate dehydrogenase family protein [Aquificaceae bacterium]HCO39432.1 prephenate dehydrogenase/arogenate dehydrogenase family protein [Aquificaceae bacterium]
MFERIVVIGVGFMGGSFALACKEAFNCKIFGLDIKKESVDKAIELGVIDEGSLSIEDIRKFNPSLVVIATPVRAFESIALSLKELISPQCIVSDLGSVKGKLVYRMEELLGSRFVGGHPIAGTEKAGVENALRDLFKGKRFIVTPTPNTDPMAKEKIKRLWEGLGSIVEEMDPYLHDFVFGAVSHLPHAVAFALMETIERLSKEVNLFKYPGGGFKDFTRIAASDPIMWRDIFLENKEELIKAMEAFEDAMKELKALILERNPTKLEAYLFKASHRRRSLEDN